MRTEKVIPFQVKIEKTIILDRINMIYMINISVSKPSPND